MALLLAALMMSAQAGTLAQLQMQASAADKVRTALQPHMDLCVGVARSAGCRAAFETALRATQPNSTRGRLYEALATSHSPPAGAAHEIQGHAIAIKFDEDPEWKRRAKVMAHDGLPFVRMPEGSNRELLVGITPHGMLGFQLKDTTGQ
ncbi:MAG TPA: hypothetical protein VK820_03465 [Steroidobacteraceae bacterium]|jgi:hypothetical protein|nr:hypothetical protein [Steroidobacteraceae bacterium]